MQKCHSTVPSNGTLVAAPEWPGRTASVCWDSPGCDIHVPPCSPHLATWQLPRALASGTWAWRGECISSPPRGQRSHGPGDRTDTRRATGGQVGARSRAGQTGTTEEPPMAVRSELLSGGARAVLTGHTPGCWVDRQARPCAAYWTPTLPSSAPSPDCTVPRSHGPLPLLPFLSFLWEGGRRRLNSPL